MDKNYLVVPFEDKARSFGGLNDPFPLFVFSEQLEVSYQEQAEFSSCDRHVQSSFVFQEPEIFAAGTNAAQNYDVLLSSLVAVNCIHFAFESFLFEPSLQVLNLRAVESNHPYTDDVSVVQFPYQLNHSLGLCRIVD